MMPARLREVAAFLRGSNGPEPFSVVCEHARVCEDAAYQCDEMRARSHVLIAEIRRCVEDDKIMAAYRKMDALDAVIRGGQ